MDITAKLMQQAARKPGVGEVRICYFDTSPPAYHARALPDHDTAQRLVVAEFQAAGRESVSLNELVDATARRVECQMHHGKGRTPEEAVRNLLVDMAKPAPKAG